MAYYTDEYVAPYLSANINGGIYTLQGKTKPFADSRNPPLISTSKILTSLIISPTCLSK